MSEVLPKDEVAKRFDRNLEAAITSLSFQNVIEILEHAPGIVSVMNINLDMLIIYSTRRYASSRSPEAEKYLTNEFCKKAEIGTMPFYIIRGSLKLPEFLREEFPSVDKSCWHDSPKKVSLEKEIQLNAA